MREDYKIVEDTKKLSVEIEANLVETLEKMSNYTKLSVSELANTALKRFISHHKDFLPTERK